MYFSSKKYVGRSAIFGAAYTKQTAQERGFSLIELLVVLALFSIVAVACAGAMLSVIDANAKARTQKQVIESARVPFDIMTTELTELKEGSTFYISGDQISFTNRSDEDVRFRRSISDGRGVLERYKDSEWQILSGPSVDITSLSFTQVAYTGGAGQYPHVLVTMGVKSGTRIKEESSFTLQTTITQQYHAPLPF